MANSTDSVAHDLGPRKRARSRIAVWAIVLVVVFVAGIAVGAFALSVWVTPRVVVVGLEAANTTESSTCWGGPQWSFDGYFHCSVTLACSEAGPGNFLLLNLSAPGASNLAVTPQLPISIHCDASATLDVAGQLGYSGSVTIFLDVF
jgi:hypothetical protein